MNDAPGQDSILRYDAITGQPAGISGQPGDAVFIATGIGGLDNPSDIVFENGSFYVASTSPSTSNSVLKFAPDGTFLGAFVPTGSGGLAGPADITFHDGYLYVASWTNNRILRYDAVSGAFVNEVVSGGGLATPLGILFEPSGDFLVASRDSGELRRYSASAAAVFTVSLSSPVASPVSVSFATADGSAQAYTDYSPQSGSLVFLPGELRKVIGVPIVDSPTPESTESFVINASNAVGATIADGQGIGTIIDYESSTKFYVVNDGSPDRTYEYGPTGFNVDTYATSSGNTAPRGAASRAAGDKIWIVDANRKVYVYNASGGLLGSWNPNGMGGSAQPEGIATDGVGIWIVDNKSDKVFWYRWGADNLFGGLSPTSSFRLASGNSNAKDIVTDGTYLWVVDDGSTDKIFKYTVSGSLLGSWTITSGGGSPTGITIDPLAVSNIWIVDSATDRVYQFDAAASRTSGSQSPSTSFALAAGNTNPQGIADPPPVDGQVPTAAVTSDEPVASDSSLLAASLGASSVSAGSASTSTGTGDSKVVTTGNQNQPSRAALLTSVLHELGLTRDDSSTSKKLASLSNADQDTNESAVDEIFANGGASLLRLL